MNNFCIHVPVCTLPPTRAPQNYLVSGCRDTTPAHSFIVTAPAFLPPLGTPCSYYQSVSPPTCPASGAASACPGPPATTQTWTPPLSGLQDFQVGFISFSCVSSHLVPLISFYLTYSLLIFCRIHNQISRKTRGRYFQQ